MFVNGEDKGKGKALPVQTMKAYLGSRDIACLIHKLSTRWGVISQYHTLATLPSGKEPRQHWKGGYVFPWSGLQILEKKNIP